MAEAGGRGEVEKTGERRKLARGVKGREKGKDDPRGQGGKGNICRDSLLLLVGDLPSRRHGVVNLVYPSNTLSCQHYLLHLIFTCFFSPATHHTTYTTYTTHTTHHFTLLPFINGHEDRHNRDEVVGIMTHSHPHPRPRPFPSSSETSREPCRCQ